MINKKSIYLSDSDSLRCSGHGKLVQLMFLNHMSNLTKFYCSVSFARQYVIASSDLPLDT